MYCSNHLNTSHDMETRNPSVPEGKSGLIIMMSIKKKCFYPCRVADEGWI
jgi:hypothetical protein